ncbi:MAG: hypothetical protein IJW13_04000 [Clostridia bacterium]|nr:hypothetical protein [Clostridia bacterium]
MYNLIIAICLFVICSGVGIKLSQKYVLRYDFFNSLLSFNKDFYSTVNFRRDSLTSALNKRYKNEQFNALLISKAKQLKNGSNLNLPNYLNEVETNEIISYFDKLGKSDAATQTRILLDYENVFSQILSECNKQKNHNGVLIKKAGIIIGLIAFVIAV